jgi:threonylcarbamoyladenosine tRNA methylthiotransferase MtaB
VSRIRTYYKEAAITTDIIVGFPGETEEDFNQTYQFVKGIQFYQTHIFRYSKRNGTKAAVMQNQIDEKTKEQRSEKLIKLSQEQEKKFLEKYIGKEISVLFEEEENEYIKGHTSNYMMVKIRKHNQNLYNKIEKIQISQIEDLHLIGKL